MVIFTGFNTLSDIQALIFNSARKIDSGGYVKVIKFLISQPSNWGVQGFSGDGFTGLALIYITFAMANWLSPSIVEPCGISPIKSDLDIHVHYSFQGHKISLIIGGCTYALYVSQFLYLNNIVLYLSSCILGIGATVIWTAHGAFLRVTLLMIILRETLAYSLAFKLVPSWLATSLCFSMLMEIWD